MRARVSLPRLLPRLPALATLVALLGSCAPAGSGGAAPAAGPDDPPRSTGDAASLDSALPSDLHLDARVDSLLARMTPEEKFWQLYMTPGDLSDPAHDYRHGAFGLQVPLDDGGLAGRAAEPAAAAAAAHARTINEIQRHFIEETRLGIPILPFDEALHGLVRPGATAFPQAIGLAASWDTALVGRVARAIAAETRSRGIRQVLSPVVNVADDPRWGRVEETYGEDPLLASAMARAFVRAFEEAGVIATPKHFVANSGAGGRDSYPIHWSERQLRERYFPPFRAALEAGARSIMTAYNSVDGLPATQNPWLLADVLRREWGFDGFVISDAAATGGATVLHMTEPSTPVAAQHAWEAGLDVVFQSTWAQHRPYLAAVTGGLVADSVLDRAVARVLRAKLRLGLFENPYVDPTEAARLNGHADHIALAREAARRSLVLLHDPDRLLPLDPTRLRALAVLGVDAVEARPGGYSGPGVAPVSILDALRSRLPDAAVSYAPGPGRTTTRHVPIPSDHLSPPASPARPAGDDRPTGEARATGDRDAESGPAGAGLLGQYFAGIRLSGEPVATRVDPGVDVRWTFNPPAPGLDRDWYSVRWTGALRAPRGGVRRVGVEGTDGYRLWIDGALVLDRWHKRSAGLHLADVDLPGGSTHDLRLEYFETVGNARVRLVWDAGAPDQGEAAIGDAAIVDAVAKAGAADVAVVVVGIEEGEFRDRAFLGLPGRQESLVRAVAATGTPTVVVVVGGCAVAMPWLEEVDAVLMAWYPGEQGGPAVADVLLGDASPAGRLPLTFPLAEGQLPLVYGHKPTGRGDDYLDLTGHPLFPFGHGLTYTEFEYSGLTVEPAAIGPTDSATVRFTVRNVGDLASDEVVQLYVRDELASMARPVLQLAGFRRIRLEPGAAREVRFTLGPDELGMLDRALRPVVEPGLFTVWAGASSRDLRLRGEVRVR